MCQVIKLSTCVKNRVPPYCWPCVYMQSYVVAKIIIISNIKITNIYFQCLVDAHLSNPEARELV